MIWIILQLLCLTTLFVLPATLYRSDYRFMSKFYGTMARSVNARKLYAQCLLIVLLLFHYVYTCGHADEFGVIFSTIVCAAMFSAERTERWLRGLLDKPRAFVALALAASVIGFIPHLYTVSVTVAFLLLAALFYPSAGIMTEQADPNKIAEWKEYPEILAESYHTHHHAELPHKADNGNSYYPQFVNHQKQDENEK